MDTLVGMRTFVTVVSLGSFTAAAERLDISTALASKYLAQLEARLGARLLNRSTRTLHTAGPRLLRALPQGPRRDRGTRIGAA
jgi:DNA-binding transcriptional LysR family regulator